MKLKYLLNPLLLLIIVSCVNNTKKEAISSEKTVKVKAVEITEKDIVFPVHSSGKLSAKTEQRLSFKTGGIINKIYVDEGQSVKKGHLLAELNLSEIKARVNLAEQGLGKAERDFKRARNLFEDSVATLEQLQNAETALEVAGSNLEIAKFNLKYSTITAPSDGRILKRLMEENEMTASGNPVFLFGSTNDKWVVRVSITDKDIINIANGDSALISFDVYQNTNFTAVVSEIGKAADPYTGTYEVELTVIPERNKKLISGFIAKVDIYPASLRQKYLSVPIDALTDFNEISGYVYVIEDSIAVRKKIEFVKILDSEVLISSGLQPGSRIITDGINYLSDSTKIEIYETAETSNR
jgi:multidrug efflux system membrane fusion protein